MLNLFMETALESKSPTPELRCSFQVSRRDGSYDKSEGTQPGRSKSYAKDEALVSADQLASSSSSFFRHEKHYPRSFLWRVVANNQILEIQCTDLSRLEKSTADAALTICFAFQDPILPLGVVFTDSASSDQIHAFICTRRNEIYNLRLPVDLFYASSNSTYTASDLCKPIDTSSLSIDTVYQLYANNPYELFVAFTGGRIQRIYRKADQEVWNQDYYDDVTWTATIRGMVGRKGLQYVEHGGVRLALTTAQGMVASPDTTYLYTLCLNHTLRVWQLSTGRLVDTRDLLDVAREPGERLQLNPAEPGLIRLVSFPKRHAQTLVTYTPHEGGQFKFWDIRGGLTGDLEIADRFPETKFSVPDPDPSGNTVWSLVSFEIVPSRKDNPGQIWLLWRNNNYHQIYTMHFDDLLDIPDAWKSRWVLSESTKSRYAAPDMVLSDSLDPTTRWLEFLFYPGRYSQAVLETTLSKFRDVTGTELPSSSASKSLRERLCLVVASAVSLRKYDNSEMDYDRFSIDTDHQWRNFWRLLESINENRLAPLSLAFDAVSQMTWVNMTGQCVAIRECSRMELLRINTVDELMKSEELIATRWPHRKAIDDGPLLEGMATVMKAAFIFRESFSPELRNEFFCAIEEQMFTESEISTPDRIVLIFNQVGLSDGLSEGAEQQLLKDLEPLGGVGGLHNDLVFSILKLLSAHSNKRHKSIHKNTLFGSSLLGVAMLEDIQLARTVLLDLLALVIFIDESNDFDPPELFDQLILMLKEQERNLWLSTHHRSSTRIITEAVNQENGPNVKGAFEQDYRHVSMMEDIFMKYVRPQPGETRPLMYLITELVAEMQRWASGRDAVTYDDATVHVQCYLLTHGEIHLASNFLKFLPTTPWASYVRGRLRLARAEYAEALVQFRKAAYTLACGRAIGDVKEMSASLLSILDAEHFNSGLPKYWQHVAALFESRKCYAQVAEAARLALQSLTSNKRDTASAFRSEILSRLFTAELQCARFAAAFDALIQFSDQALQKTSVAALVNAILDPQASATGAAGALNLLQTLPWSTNPRLATFLDVHLTGLAKKQVSVLGSGNVRGLISRADYQSILQAYRLSRCDYRGAAEVQLQRLRLIQRSGQSRSDPNATAIRQAMLTLINMMNCMTPNEAFILADTETDSRPGLKRGFETEKQSSQRKRRVITLTDLRKDYQKVLDKCSRIERGDFGFGGGSEESDDEDYDPNTSKLNGSAMET